jgi:hypothetical protein
MPESMTSRLTLTARHRATNGLMLATLAAGVLAGCGGGGALDNAPTLTNAAGAGANGQTLSFAYFQKCVNQVLNTPQTVVGSSSTCAASGCHDNTNGTGGALRLRGSAQDAGLPSTPEAEAAVRASDMYKNFYSSLGETVVGAPDQSRLLNKPLVRGVLHGGGLIFASPDDSAAKTIRYWINRPMPQGQDEFSSAAATMFTPPDAASGACNTE